MKLQEAFADREPIRILGILVGAAIYAAGMNLFIVPAGLYTGGVMGSCQVIRTLLVQNFHLDFGGLDIAGILNYLVNIPILLIAWQKIDRRFVGKTVIAVTAITVFLSVIPVRDVLEGDRLAKCLLGGLCVGAGGGTLLYMGANSGGSDVIGILLMRHDANLSVGRINLCANVLLYCVCAILFQVPTALYSVIFAMVNSYTVDKLHSQNINVELTIITKTDTRPMEQEILAGMHRGITKLTGEGEYTSEPVTMLYVVVSKYEVYQVRRIVNKYDPHAFVVAKRNAIIYGNYLKKL